MSNQTSDDNKQGKYSVKAVLCAWKKFRNFAP